MKKAGLMLFLVLTFFCSSFVGAVTINVCPACNYTAIQDAIDNASNGDVINVSTGSYNEDLVIDKELDIIGSGTTSTTVLNGVHIIASDNVIISEFILVSESGETTITIDTLSSAIKNIEISKNVFNITDSPSVGIYLGGGLNKISDVKINNNIFNGPSDQTCNPWKIGGWFGNPISAEVDNIDFENNVINNCSIPINLDDKNIKNILINNNIFRGTDGALYIWGEDSPIGMLSNFVFTNNDLDSSNLYGIGIFGWDGSIVNDIFDDSNFGVGNRINYNSFVGIPGKYGLEAVSILANLSSYELNAEYNYWGACNGPGPIGPGSGAGVSTNVSYTPWLGICIENKTNATCVFEIENITLSADLTGEEIDSVWFSYTINGTNYNKTASHVGGNKYQIIIPSSELIGGQNITWNVYANDSLNVYNNSWKTFYVRKKTQLSVSPLNPDGDNGWYVTEPEFTLIKDSLGGNSYYQWDSDDIFLYTVPFGLENIPNPPEESAGTLELNWWSDFGVVCGNESKQSKMFYIDLTNPLITNLKPTNNSVVYNNLKPEISAYLDEVYGSNSGIDTEIVQMSLNGNPVPAIVNLTDTLDAIITYIPTSNLNLGNHNVSVNVTDNAGRNSELTWFFYINITPVFTMQVNSPQSKIYDSKRIPFNITLSENVEKIEYINWDDRTPRWKNLCKDCNEYGFIREKTKTLNEGWNNITIKATDFFGQSKEENRSLFIDSKEPRIHRTEPKRNSVINGSEFYIKYTEENLNKTELFWNGSKELNCSKGSNQECATFVNLSSHNGEQIEYWFKITDIINNIKESKKTKIKVDTKSPVINSIEYKIDFDRKKIELKINATEENLDKIQYKDLNQTNPQFRTICRSLNNGICEKTISFKGEIPNIQILALDKAGNSDVELTP